MWRRRGEERRVQVASDPDAVRGRTGCSLGPCRAWADSRRRQGMGDGGGVEPSRRHLALAALQPGGGVYSPLPSPPLLPHEKSLTTTPPPLPLRRRFLLSGSIPVATMVREAGERRRKRSFVGPFQGRRISWRLERAKAKAETFGVGLSRCCRAGSFFPILKRMAGSRGGGGEDTSYSVETQERSDFTFYKTIFSFLKI